MMLQKPNGCYLGEVCIQTMETSNEFVLSDSCEWLNPEGTAIISCVILIKAFCNISDQLSVHCSESTVRNLGTDSDNIKDNGDVDWFSDDLLVLTEADIPGASLNGKEPSELNAIQLKRWLACRGAQLTGKKPQLVER